MGNVISGGRELPAVEEMNPVEGAEMENVDGKKGKPVEIVIISGKGGTGKTSLTAAFAVLNKGCIVADCDVDAADLHLLLKPEIIEEHEFWSGHNAIIRAEDCTGCGICAEHCRFEAIKENGSAYEIDELSCEGCGLCVRLCPEKAIDFPPRLCGKWMVSRTRTGPMIHAQLGIAAENSGRLVAVVRKRAKEEAESKGISLILIDGPPGIGCPVISSITGADMVVVVVEPTVSGEHDMKRALELAKHFNIPAGVCINKWDINGAAAERIEKRAEELGACVLGRIPYDPVFVKTQLDEITVVEANTRIKDIVENIWKEIREFGGKHGISWS